MPRSFVAEQVTSGKKSPSETRSALVVTAGGVPVFPLLKLGSSLRRRSLLTKRLLSTSIALLLLVSEWSRAETVISVPAAQQLIPSITAAQGKQDVRPLESGKPLERELAGGQAHTYEINLTANQYLHVVVEQRGIDVVVVLFRPDGKKLTEVDSPNGTQGPEPLSWIAETMGQYRLEIRSLEKEAAAGRYEVKLAELRVANDQDRKRLVAERLFSEGEGLRAQGTAEPLRKAITKYEEVVSLWQAIGAKSEAANTLYLLGYVNFLLGEQQKALGYYNQALPIRRAVGDRSGEATTLNNMGAVYSNLGEQQKALEYFNQALPIRHAVGDRGGEATTLSNMGAVYSDLGEQQKALEYYNQALPIWRAIGDRPGEATTLNNMGGVYSDLGEQQKALEYYNQALPIRRAVGDRGGEATTLSNMGAVHSDLGEKQKALGYYYQALPLHRAVGDRSGEAKTIYHLAIAERKLDRLNEARTHIETALQIVESLRTKVVSPELRASFFAARQDYYGAYIDLLMQLHKQDASVGHSGAALQASERSRARSLLDLLTEAHADIRQGVDQLLVAHERSLQQRLNGKATVQSQLLNKSHTEAQAAQIKKEIDEITTELQQVQTQIRQSSPRYTALTQPQPLTLAEIQQQVRDPDTILLEYSLGEERSYLWAVTPTTIQSYELPKRAEIEAAAQQVYDWMAAETGNTRNTAVTKPRRSAAPKTIAYPPEAAQLSKILLGPVAEQLGQKRLLIVPDGKLHYLPFGALPDPQITGRTGTQQPLLVAHEIVTLPSASVLAVQRRDLDKRQPAAKTIAIVADPVYEKNDSRFQALAQTTAPAKTQSLTRPGSDRIIARLSSRGGKPLGRLNSSGEEGDGIAALVPVGERQLAKGFEASRAMVESGVLSQYRYVHFATHGLLDAERPELSSLVLSLYDAQGNAQDGFLRAHEIYNLNLPAEVVVLSACQTALGKRTRGEGLVGLTRGFLYAGAKTVVASLWSVDDGATAVLMKRFYQLMLKEKMKPVAALRQAQLERWRLGREPMHWRPLSCKASGVEIVATYLPDNL